MVIKELHISIGLPGSGKTTEFDKLFENSNNKRKNIRIQCDSFLTGSRPTYKNMSELILDRSRLFCEITFLDGLFLTLENVKEVVDSVKDRVKKVVIHYWEPNIEACKWNDEGRRSLDSSITIENAKIDSLDEIKKIKDSFDNIEFLFKIHIVKRKPEWKHFSDVNGLYCDENGIVKGGSWSLGGTWGDCWGSHGSVSPGERPDGMAELDTLLEKVAPNISFLQYKKITNECVSTEDFSERDYYGGCVYYSQYVLDVKSLIDILNDII